MRVSTREVLEATIVDVVGNVDLSNSPELRRVLLELLREKHIARVIVNLQGAKYIDSSGVATLVEAFKIARETGSRFIIYGLSRTARQVLELSRLITVFEVYDNEEQALKA